MNTVYTVSQVNQYLKRKLDGDALLSGLLVRGEISNYKYHSPTGHHYFSLKDEGGAIRCVLFRGDAARVRFRLADGMRVIASGRVSVFPQSGQYQLYCTQLMAEGVGDLHAAFEALKRRLEEEGLFDPRHKKPIPAMPGRVALVTSASGAAVQDMLRILGERWPMAEVVVVPAKVQGEGAAEEVAAGIDRVNREKLGDVIITGRGGGSMEDLWAFNEEAVAWAIYRSQVPVISAVGHEPDVTIADYVADLRAATPSNAAELAVPDRRAVRARLDALGAAMARALEHRVGNSRRRLEELGQRRALSDLSVQIQDRRLLLDGAWLRTEAALRNTLAAGRAQAGRLAAALDALSPMRVLGRGYSITELDGAVLRSVDGVALGDRVTIRMTDGTLTATVTGRKKEGKGYGGKKAEL